MKKLTREQILELARVEWNNLQKYATPEELSRLPNKALNGQEFDECIYGLMTGSCESDRAIVLINVCAPCVLKRFTKEVSNRKRSAFHNFSPLETLIIGCTSEGYQDFADISGLTIKAIIEGSMVDEPIIETFTPKTVNA